MGNSRFNSAAAPSGQEVPKKMIVRNKDKSDGSPRGSMAFGTHGDHNACRFILLFGGQDRAVEKAKVKRQGRRLLHAGCLLILALLLSLLPLTVIARAASDLDQQLIKAAARGDLPMVRSLLDKGANLNAKGVNGTTILMEAAAGGNLDLVKFLIDQGLDINAKRPDGETVLIYAAIGRNPEVLRFVVKKGLDVNAKTKHGRTALMFASMAGKLRAVEYLVERGVDVNARNSHGHSALWYANMFTFGAKVAEYLKSRGAK
jgi:ankyrin repeat protein